MDGWSAAKSITSFHCRSTHPTTSCTHAASAGLTRFALATLDILDDVLRKLAPPPDLLTNLTGARKPAAALGRRDPDRLSCRRNRVDRDSEAV